MLAGIANWLLPMPSTVIRTFNYEPERRRLIIEFQSGRRYAYFDVPPDIHAAMRGARSRGSYFNSWIRDRYSYTRLDDCSDVRPADAGRRRILSHQ